MEGAGNELEKSMLDYQRFGSSVREAVENDLSKLSTEVHLCEKVGCSEKIRGVKQADPDLRNREVMEMVFQYYQSLHNIYLLLVDKREVEKEKRMVRPYLVDKYYLKLEAGVVELLERVRLVRHNADKFAELELVHDIKEYYRKEYFHNLHFFLAILFKE